MADKWFYITPTGLAKLENELSYLRTVRRRQVADRIHDALEEIGDLDDNAAYEAAKLEQSFIEGRIKEIERTLARARLIDVIGPSDVTHIGSKVVVQEDNGEPEDFMIVGYSEANSRVGLISYESPLGQALLGRRAGEEILVDAPAGILHFRILRVSS
ncbi:MAG: GreA/GreB family elongation factor [Candidatus Hodarchaeota archaeon]